MGQGDFLPFVAFQQQCLMNVNGREIFSKIKSEKARKDGKLRHFIVFSIQHETAQRLRLEKSVLKRFPFFLANL